ncbi:migration and invasion-inhibitory protein [Castor canadensis]|uniref:Migration and invasion-inhibitory protein n=1 Tax=Castor canadensis TaxID=51338 RepID=A0A8B7UCM7_CASCN|nr:migration and invasion-inhibitory protein [Castor canadensis]XP_020015661.1 migration and invasion-inhibitory protein [Castor canadensis]
MGEMEDLVQLRLLNLELLRQLWAGQKAVRRSVAKATSGTLQSSLYSSSSYDSETPVSPETSSAFSGASCSQDKRHVGDSLDTPRGIPHDRISSRVASLPPAKCQHPESLESSRPRSAPLPPTTEPVPSAGLGHLRPPETQAPRSMLAGQSKPSKTRVTFSQESAVPERNWRLWPYLGYDWIAGALDSSSPVTSESETFFSTLQKFREENKEECIHGYPEAQFLGLHESSDMDDDHQCVYCYRINRRLFPVPVDPDATCRLCRTPRDQRGPETLLEPAQVRVSIPLSVLDPPHRYRIHRRKSFDASDTLALPRHCLLGWDVFPPKSEKSSAPKSLDLWSSVSSEAQHRKLLASSPSCLALPARVLPPAPIWSEPQLPQPHAPPSRSPEDSAQRKTVLLPGCTLPSAGSTHRSPSSLRWR